MRKQNSEFKTAFTSEADLDLKNTDFFGFVELDDFACYVTADGIDDQTDAVSARLAVAAVVATFSEAPSMSKRTMAACLKAANKALLEAKSKMKLKASIIVVLTNYVKLRYGQAGNVRLRLYRNGFLKLQSTDQSLTADLVKEEKVEADKVAVHEERNNLYTYLGQEKEFHPFISKKVKLTNTDTIALYTRGIWDHVDEGELKDVFAEATDNPQKSVDDIEDLLLSRQPGDLRKYTFAVLFVNRIFTDPNKKRKIKRAVMIAIPILVVMVVLTVMLVVRYRKNVERRNQMELGYTDTIEYIQTDNYIRAEERCKDAQKYAGQLKDQRMQKELGNYQKLIETVIAAEEQLNSKKYADSQKSFQEAANRSRYVDNIGLDYIEDKLALTANYISVYDLINLGDTLTLNLQYGKAEEKYLEAKAMAGRLYFDEGRTTAMEALEKLYAKQKEEIEADNEEVKDQVVQQAAGANHVALGDEAFAQGDYESANVYYTTAQLNYAQLGDDTQQAAVAVKLEATKKKMEQKALLEAEAEIYLSQAAAVLDAKDFVSAKKYYLLAKDIYASLKMDDKVNEVARKMEVLEIKESEKESQEAKEEALTAMEQDASEKDRASGEKGPGIGANQVES